MNCQEYGLIKVLGATLVTTAAFVVASSVCNKPKKTNLQGGSKNKAKKADAPRPSSSSTSKESLTPRDSAQKAKSAPAKESKEKTKEESPRSKKPELVTCEDQLVLSVVQPPPVDLSQVPREIIERLNAVKTQVEKDDDEKGLLSLMKTQSLEGPVKVSVRREPQKLISSREKPPGSREKPPGAVAVKAPSAQPPLYKPTTYVTALAGATKPVILQEAPVAAAVPEATPKPPEPAGEQLPLTGQKKAAAAPSTTPVPQATVAPAQTKGVSMKAAPQPAVPIPPGQLGGPKAAPPGVSGAAQPQKATQPAVSAPPGQQGESKRAVPGVTGAAQPQKATQPAVSAPPGQQGESKRAVPGVSGAVQSQKAIQPGVSVPPGQQGEQKAAVPGVPPPQKATQQPSVLNKAVTAYQTQLTSQAASGGVVKAQTKIAPTVVSVQSKMPSAVVPKPPTAGVGTTTNQAGASNQPAVVLQTPLSSAPSSSRPTGKPPVPPKPTTTQLPLGNKPTAGPSLVAKAPILPQSSGVPRATIPNQQSKNVPIQPLKLLQSQYIDIQPGAAKPS